MHREGVPLQHRKRGDLPNDVDLTAMAVGCATHVQVEHDGVSILEPLLVDTGSRCFELLLQVGGVLEG